MLAEGNLVRPFLTPSHRRDTLLDLTDRTQEDRLLFPATLTRQMRPFCKRPRQTQRLSFAQGWSGSTGWTGRQAGKAKIGRKGQLCYLHCIACKCGALLRWSGCLLS